MLIVVRPVHCHQLPVLDCKLTAFVAKPFFCCPYYLALWPLRLQPQFVRDSFKFEKRGEPFVGPWR